MSWFTPPATDERIVELCRLLADAEGAVRSQPTERLMDEFASNLEFADFIRDSREGILSGRSTWLARRKLSLSFAPTGDWDDCVGDIDLGERIYRLLGALYGVWR